MKNRAIKQIGFTLLTLYITGCISENPKELESEKQNILFISIDDLRPKLGSYGETKMITPNI